MVTTEEQRSSQAEDRELHVSWARPSAIPEADRPAGATLESRFDERALLNRLREAVWKRHYSGPTRTRSRTGPRFLRFHGGRDPRGKGKGEGREVLSYLSGGKEVAPPHRQNQAFSACSSSNGTSSKAASSGSTAWCAPAHEALLWSSTRTRSTRSYVTCTENPHRRDADVRRRLRVLNAGAWVKDLDFGYGRSRARRERGIRTRDDASGRWVEERLNCSRGRPRAARKRLKRGEG
jgi:hypothetical protein